VVPVWGARSGAADDPPPAAPAAPVEAPPTFAELVAAHKAAVESRDRPEQMRLLRALAAEAAKAVADPLDEAAETAVRERRKAAHAILRRALTTRDFEVVIAAIDGYAILRLPGSSADLRPFAERQASEKRPPPVRLAAVGAWAAIHDPGTHGTLLEHIRLPQTEPDKADLALAAARGLASYEPARGAARYEFLRDFLQTFDAILNTTSYVASPTKTEWFALLAPEMLRTFNAHTHAGVRTHAGAVAWWRDNRRKVQAGTE
jgi:hypothetical protein